MSNSEEMVDYYDTEGNIIGFCTRKEADDKNYIYPNAIVFVFTNDNKVWIQKRSLSKSHYPGLWDTSACGAIEHGEDPKKAAERELKEEINVECDLILVEKFLNIFKGEGNQTERARMSYLYIGITDQTPTGNDEVEAVAKFDLDELLEELKKNPDSFIPSFDIEIEKCLPLYKQLSGN